MKSFMVALTLANDTNKKGQSDLDENRSISDAICRRTQDRKNLFLLRSYKYALFIESDINQSDTELIDSSISLN